MSLKIQRGMHDKYVNFRASFRERNSEHEENKLH